MTPKVILAHGAESAERLAQAYGSAPIQKWIAVDAYAQEVFTARDIPFADESAYLGGDPARLKEIGWTAYRWSVEWFRNLPGIGSAGPEALSIRSFNYYFLSVLCAFQLLDSIAAKEGKCVLATPRFPHPSDEADLRFENNPTPVPLLLERIKGRWPFEVDFLEMPARPQKAPASFDFGDRLPRLLNRFRNAKILFSGNPSLLAPVRRRLQKDYGRACATVRPFTLASFGAAADRSVFFVPSQRQAPRRSLWDETGAYAAFKKNKTFEWQGADLLPAVWDTISAFMNWERSGLTELYEGMRRTLKDAAPDFLIVDEDVVETNRALTAAAKSLGIKTLVVSHGLPGAPFGFVPLVADHFAAWGPNMREAMEGWSVEAERLLVTGCPKYDTLAISPAQKISRSDLCRDYGWDAQKPIVLVVPGGFPRNPYERLDGCGSTSSEMFRTADFFLRAARAMPSVQFIFKFRAGHHSERIFDRLAEKRGGRPANLRLLQEGFASDYMPIADLIFNNCSSACLEAVLLKRPVVNMNFAFHDDVFPFAAHGLGASVRTYEELKNILQRLEAGSLPLADWVRSQEGLVEAFLLSRDGGAAGRVAAFVERRLNGGRPVGETSRMAPHA